MQSDCGRMDRTRTSYRRMIAQRSLPDTDRPKSTSIHSPGFLPHFAAACIWVVTSFRTHRHLGSHGK
jgi:hypothetical protein